MNSNTKSSTNRAGKTQTSLSFGQNEVKENLEDLQKLLKSKDDELQKVLQKASEFQTRLDRLTRVLKQQDGFDNE